MAMRKVYISKTDKKVLGVIGGIAEALGVDSTLLRVLFILLMLLTGVVPMVIAYFLWWLIIPDAPRSAPKETTEKSS